jgi:hypothetical protein
VIDARVFSAAMVQLGGVFAREVDKPTMATYYQILSPRMTTDEFRAAVDRVLVEEAFWPSPAVIMRAATNDGDALSALSTLMSELDRQHGYRFVSHEWFVSLPAAVRFAVKTVGGLRVLSMCTTDEWPRLERRFVAAYNTHVRNADAERIAAVSASDRELPLDVTPADRSVRRIAPSSGDDDNGNRR